MKIQKTAIFVKKELKILIKNLFIFINHFLMIRVAVDPASDPGTLGAR